MLRVTISVSKPIGYENICYCNDKPTAYILVHLSERVPTLTQTHLVDIYRWRSYRWRACMEPVCFYRKTSSHLDQGSRSALAYVWLAITWRMKQNPTLTTYMHGSAAYTCTVQVSEIFPCSGTYLLASNLCRAPLPSRRYVST